MWQALPFKAQDLVFLLCVFAATSLALRHYIKALKHRNILEDITERSLHTMPVPTGGGWVVIGCIAISLLVYAKGLSNTEAKILGCVLVLAGVSWIDDLKSLTPAIRFAVHVACVALALSTVEPDVHILPIHMGFVIDRFVVALAWVWLINLYNFMDGIDGMAACDSIQMFLGFVLLGLLVGIERNSLIVAMAAIAACASFLRWNWNPSSVLLGDVGSIPFGFLIGWFLLDITLKGYFAAALILPLYYLFDATSTLLVRLARGQKIFKPHREHFYQRAVLGGLTHGDVVVRVSIARFVLIALALASVRWPVPSLIAAVLVAGGTLAMLEREARRGGGGLPFLASVGGRLERDRSS
ncbi:MAG: hypothetical protein AB7E70_20770 [Hyphomicrobiaceae bacterium]